MLDAEIREQIARYMNSTIDAGDLEAWFSGDPEVAIDGELESTRRLFHDAARLIAERMNGDWTDKELRAKLGALSRTYWLESAPKVLLFSSSDVKVIQEGPSRGAAGTSLATASE